MREQTSDGDEEVDCTLYLRRSGSPWHHALLMSSQLGRNLIVTHACQLMNGSVMFHDINVTRFIPVLQQSDKKRNTCGGLRSSSPE